MPDLWREALALWRDIATPYLGRADGAVAPDANDQHMLLQALIGAFPLRLLEEDDPDELGRFGDRFHGYVAKALREAKRHSSWVNSNAAYEKAALSLVDACLSPGSTFLKEFRPLLNRLALAGTVIGLGRTVLKCTVPGVPDLYQGTGFWDFSLVDPDNRRPVDYQGLAAALERPSSIEELVARWRDGGIKQHVLSRLLADRAAAPELYAQGSYERLGSMGPEARVLAFRRRSGPEELVVAVARLATQRDCGQTLPIGTAWGAETLRLPAGTWRSVIEGRTLEIDPHGAPAAELFAALPVSVLRRTE
jgi:(1->4)-alpha-D-glucan 1-alpha-D-glucosylmutase